MRKLIMTQLTRKAKSNLAVFLEVIVLIIVCNVLLGRLLPFIQGERLYDSLGLSEILCCTSERGKTAVSELVSAAGASVVQQNYQSKPVTEQDLWLQPVSTSYMDRFYPSKTDVLTQGIPAIVPRSLSARFRLGQTYALPVQDTETPLSFTVVHMLDNDMMFLPPAGDASMEIVSSNPNTILLVVDDRVSGFFELSNVYTLEAGSGDAEQVAAFLNDNDPATMAMSARTAREHSNMYDLHMMGMPIILTVTVVLLCLAGMLSNTLLSIIANERLNSIYYICGYTWRKCAAVQALCDLLIVLCAIMSSLIIMWILSGTGGSIQLRWPEFMISTGLALSVLVLAEIMGISQISKSNAAELAERMK